MSYAYSYTDDIDDIRYIICVDLLRAKGTNIYLSGMAKFHAIIDTTQCSCLADAGSKYAWSLLGCMRLHRVNDGTTFCFALELNVHPWSASDLNALE